MPATYSITYKYLNTMSNIFNYKTNSESQKPFDARPKTENPSVQIAKFAQYLHSFVPVLVKEFNTLEKLNNNNPNNVFPIKMKALAEIAQASEPLYKWYVERARKNTDRV